MDVREVTTDTGGACPQNAKTIHVGDDVGKKVHGFRLRKFGKTYTKKKNPDG